MRNRTIASTLVIAGMSAALLLVGGSATAAPSTIVVTQPSDIGATRVDGAWFADQAGEAAFSVTKDGPGGDAALRMDLTSTADKVYLYNTFAAGDRPGDIPALLEGASYAYAGTNVNFQVELIFEPSNVALYGPSGTSKACTPASTWYGWGLTADADWCYTVLKWEPYVSGGTDAWTTVDLSVDTAASSALQRGGWVSSKNLGQYAGNVSLGQTMATYLGETADYAVTGFAFGVGSGTAGPTTGWMRDYTIGGVGYEFGADQAVPVAPPAADSAALQELLHDEGIDVAADTARFSTTGDGGTGLDGVDAGTPFHGVLADWADSSDFFVDVYVYSSPTFVGTFPVVDGDVQLDGVDLSGLTPGVHHLVFIGQSSGAVAAVQLTIISPAAAEGTALAPTGLGIPPLAMLAVGLVGAGLVIRMTRRTA